MPKKRCPHDVKKGECVICDPRIHVILHCKKCAKKGGGQTWHSIVGKVATCRKCGTTREPMAKKPDINIRNH